MHKFTGLCGLLCGTFLWLWDCQLDTFQHHVFLSGKASEAVSKGSTSRMGVSGNDECQAHHSSDGSQCYEVSCAKLTLKALQEGQIARYG